MPTASAQQIAAMDAAQAEVERLLVVAEERADFLSSFSTHFLTASQEQSIQNVRSLRRRFNTWIDGQGGPRRWAIDGRTDAGRTYTPQEWADFGRELGELAAKEAELSLTHNLFTLYTPVGALGASGLQAGVRTANRAEVKVRAAAAAVAEVFTPSDKPWSWKTKLAIGTAVGLVVLGTTAYAASSFSPFLALLGKREKE